MPSSAATIDLDHLHEQGYAVVRGFLPDDACQTLREHMDSLLPPIAPRAQPEAPRVRMCRHPIPGDIMAEMAARPSLLDLAARAIEGQVDDLQMLEQVLIRTDPSDPPYGPLGWHIDKAFFPSEYEARPRRTYYHCVHALDDVAPGQAATHLVPGSHLLTYAAARRMTTPEELDTLKQNPIEVAGIDTGKAIEVCPNQGDVLVFNPMCLHAAAPNRVDKPRYVYFASFMDRSASDLRDWLLATRYHTKGYANVFRDALPEHRRHLVAWCPQADAESDPS